jgi:hypothetical protein
MIKEMPNIKLNWIKLTEEKCKLCTLENIKETKPIDIDWMICNNIIDDIKILYSNILYVLYNIIEGANLILTLNIPINYKIIIDILYLLFLSFENIYIIKPIQDKFGTNFYVVCINYKKIIIEFDELFRVLDNKIIDNLSIINTDYNDDFKYQFINVINQLTSHLIQIINMQLFYTDFWKSIDDNIKAEIKTAIHIKNKNYVDKYFKF